MYSVYLGIKICPPIYTIAMRLRTYKSSFEPYAFIYAFAMTKARIFS